MEGSFSAALSHLRRGRNLSQRQLSADLKISQALLSHYENGTREPGLAFVRRACEYFDVSADYLLGMTTEEQGSAVSSTFPAVSELEKLTEQIQDNAVRNALAAFVDASVRRMISRITRMDGALRIAEISCDMAKAELSLLNALSDNESVSEKKV